MSVISVISVMKMLSILEKVSIGRERESLSDTVVCWKTKTETGMRLHLHT
jgi:hypothetical protein